MQKKNHSYLQFYNGSANSALTTVAIVDDGDLDSAAYGDSTTLIIVESGDVDLEFFRTDADDNDTEVLLERTELIGINEEVNYTSRLKNLRTQPADITFHCYINLLGSLQLL